MSPEARLGDDGVPRTAGWFVLNARDAPWEQDGLRSRVRFGGEGEAHFDQVGVGLYWLEPGEAMALYHHEAGQEDFLVVDGEALLIVEGAERELVRWDLVHCPPQTPHTIVARGDRPAVVLAVGARTGAGGTARYPVDPAAVRHNAGRASTDEVPYERFGQPRGRTAPPLP